MSLLKECKIERAYMGRLSYGEDLLMSLKQECEVLDVKSGWINAMGALQNATLAYYDQDQRKYRSYFIEKAMEIVSLTGNVSEKEGHTFIHAHAVLSDADGNTVAGHVLEGCEIFACEMTLHAYGAKPFQRVYDEQTGLFLWEKQ